MDQLDRIERKIDRVLQAIQGNLLLATYGVPDHLRTTYLTVNNLKRASATDVSSITHKARAVESNYLNQLTGMGLLLKERVKRIVYFSIANYS